MVIFGYKFTFDSARTSYKYFGFEFCSLGIFTFSFWTYTYSIDCVKQKGIK